MIEFRLCNALIVRGDALIITNIELDRLDRKILTIVQQNNLTPHREIAEAIGLSAPAVTRRLKRLRKSGVIKYDTSTLSKTALGKPLTIIAQVQAKNEQIENLDRMRTTFLECPQIQHCYYVTGGADFILIINVSDMSEYEQLTRKMFFEPSNVKRFTTFVSLETIKAGNTVVV